MTSKIIPIDQNYHNLKLSFDEFDWALQDYIHRMNTVVDRAMHDLMDGDLIARESKKRDHRASCPVVLNEIPCSGINLFSGKENVPFPQNRI